MKGLSVVNGGVILIKESPKSRGELNGLCVFSQW